MVCAPVRSIIPSLKLGDYLSVQAHKPCSISHLTLFVHLFYLDFQFYRCLVNVYTFVMDFLGWFYSATASLYLRTACKMPEKYRVRQRNDLQTTLLY